MHDAYINILAFMDQGGNVLWWIALVTFLMWSMIFERIWYFQTEHKSSSGTPPSVGRAAASAAPGVPTRSGKASSPRRQTGSPAACR